MKHQVLLLNEGLHFYLSLTQIAASIMFLTSQNAEYNSLNGPIPTDIGSLSNLTELKLCK